MSKQNEDIEKMINDRPWRERLGGLDFNPAYKKQIIELIEGEIGRRIEDTLKERDNEVLQLLDDMEETNEDVWTSHEVKQEIRKFLKES